MNMKETHNFQTADILITLTAIFLALRYWDSRNTRMRGQAVTVW
jgi:hypothetical protein